MAIKSLHRTLAAKATLAKSKGLAPIKLLTAAPNRKLRNGDRTDILTMISLGFFYTVAVLLLCCTGIDILRQSFSSGQFWNSIIVVVCLGIIVVWALGLNLVRQVDSNRWEQAIPRRHQIGRSDIGGRMMSRILEVRHNCISLFKNQMDFSSVEHEGLQNPLRRHGSGNGSEGVIETPYWEFADTIPIFLEDSFTVTAPNFTIPPSYTLRDYIEHAISEKLLDTAHIMPSVQRFLDLYDLLRYSGRAISHEELIEMMELFGKILSQIQQPEDVISGLPLFTRQATENTNQSTSMILHNTSSSPSFESVKIYPSRESMATNSSFGSPVSSNASVIMHNI